MKVQFSAKILNKKFTLTKPSIFNAYCSGLDDGNYYIEVHKAKGPEKTLSQLAYHYAVVVPTVFNQLKEDGVDTFVIKIKGKEKEVPLTYDIVDMMLKEACAKFDGKKITNKRNMSKQEACIFIEAEIRWAAKYLSCVIPSPDEKG